MENQISVLPGSLELSRLTRDRSRSAFDIREIRSLTVHHEHAGWFRVVAVDPETGDSVLAGTYEQFSDARKIVDSLNQCWANFPRSEAAEVLAFARGELVSAARITLDTLSCIPAFGDTIGNFTTKAEIGLALALLERALGSGGAA